MKLNVSHRNLYQIGVFILILISAMLLRTYNLNWGAPFYFHPDERNIASSVSQLSFPNQLNPHFFAYGSITIYLIFIAGLLFNIISSFFTHQTITSVSFEHAIIISRILSSIYSVLTLIMIFLITKKFTNRSWATVALLIATYSTGLIQYAHFGTVESSLAFFFLLCAYVLIKYIESKKLYLLIISFIIVSIACAIKISSMLLMPIPMLTTIYVYKSSIKKSVKSLAVLLTKLVALSVLFMGLVSGVFLATSPFAIFDYTSFIGSITYETNVATGNLPVFYTGDFFNQNSFLYPLLHVYPFLLNPVILIVFIPCLIMFVLLTIKKRNIHFALLLIFFDVLFNTQAALFTKWTRYFVPSLPFVYIIIIVTLYHYRQLVYKHSIIRSAITAISGVLLLSSFIWGLSFLITTYIEPDTRVAAANFARLHIPSNSQIISEVYDLGIVPFNPNFSHISLINFYDVDQDPLILSTVNQSMDSSNYFILPSQRILSSRIHHPQKFPRGYEIYHSLTTGRSNFTRIYQTPCSIFCKIVYFNNPIDSFEQTASVFDKPFVMIYTNNNYYEKGTSTP